MRTTAITALLVAGAASVAQAQPPKEEVAPRVSYRTEAKPPSTLADWVEIASPTPAKHGRVFITVDGRYAQLRIDAHQGRPFVQSVRILYADGKQRVVKINRALGGTRKSELIEVSATRPIDHVIVVTDARSKGTYTVSGAPAEATGVATR